MLGNCPKNYEKYTPRGTRAKCAPAVAKGAFWNSTTMQHSRRRPAPKDGFQNAPTMGKFNYFRVALVLKKVEIKLSETLEVLPKPIMQQLF